MLASFDSARSNTHFNSIHAPICSECATLEAAGPPASPNETQRLSECAAELLADQCKGNEGGGGGWYQFCVSLQVVQDLASAQGEGRLDGVVSRAGDHQHSAYRHCPHCLHLRALCEEGHLAKTVAHSQILPAHRLGGCTGVQGDAKGLGRGCRGATGTTQGRYSGEAIVICVSTWAASSENVSWRMHHRSSTFSLKQPRHKCDQYIPYFGQRPAPRGGGHGRGGEGYLLMAPPWCDASPGSICRATSSADSAKPGLMVSTRPASTM